MALSRRVRYEKSDPVGYHEALASALAIKSYHEMEQGGVIGIILNLTPSYPRDESNPLKMLKQRANKRDAFFNRSFLDPAVKASFQVN